MQYKIKKQNFDTKLKVSIVILIFVCWALFNMWHIMEKSSIIVMLLLTMIILIIVYPYIRYCINIFRYRAINKRMTDYTYIEWGDNGLFFSYPEQDIRIDTNIKQCVIKKTGWDYLFIFGEKKEFLIPSEKPEDWEGEDKYSFMYIAKLIAKVKYANLPLILEGKWSIENVHTDIANNNKNYLLELKESNINYEKLTLDSKGLKLSKKNGKDFFMDIKNISIVYKIKTPKNHYWLNILNLQNDYLVIKLNNSWLVWKI